MPGRQMFNLQLAKGSAMRMRMIRCHLSKTVTFIPEPQQLSLITKIGLFLRFYDIMSLHSDCRAKGDGRADARQMPRVLSEWQAAGEDRA